ncbi:MAG: hypothetical protein PVG04_08815, partial [Anaerolineales bacterium]
MEMEDLDSLITSYRNVLIGKTVGETGNEARRDLLKQAEAEHLYFLKDTPGGIPKQARRLLHPAHAIATLIQRIR